MSDSPPILFDFQLYVIGASREGPLKIGFSKEPWARLKQLQCGHPNPLDVLATFMVRSVEEAALLESSVHQELRRWRASGEWFAIPIEFAICAIWIGHLMTGLDPYPGHMGTPGDDFRADRLTWRQAAAEEHHRRMATEALIGAA